MRDNVIFYEGGDILRNVPVGQSLVMLARDPEKHDGFEHYAVLRDRSGDVALYAGAHDLRPVEMIFRKKWDMAQNFMDYDPAAGRFVYPAYHDPMTVVYLVAPAPAFTSVAEHDRILEKHGIVASSYLGTFGSGVPRKYHEPLRYLTVYAPKRGPTAAVIERVHVQDNFPLSIIHSEFNIRGAYNVNFKTGEIKGAFER